MNPRLAVILVALTLGGCGAPAAPEPTVTVRPVVAAAGGTSPSPTPSVVTAALGEALEINDGSAQVRYTAAASGMPENEFGSGQKADRGSWYPIRLKVEVIAGDQYAAASVVALVAADGSVFEGDTGFGFKGTLDSIELHSGQKTEGVVLFDIPTGAAKGARIELRARQSQQAFWSLP